MDFNDITFRHRIPVQLRFNDIDMFGHVNNAMYLQYFDMGKLAFFKQYMDGDFEHQPTVPVVVNINVDFHQPTLIDEHIFVETAMEHIGDTSLTLVQRIITDRGTVKCSARTVMVNIDVATHQPATVSPAWREALLAGK